METDLTKIKKYAKDKENENWSFRTFLKNYDDRNIDSIVYRLFKKADESIDCTTCGNCCKEIKPVFTKKDISRYFKLINMEPFFTLSFALEADGVLNTRHYIYLPT